MAVSADRDFKGFEKIFRDLRLHVEVGLKLYQARRTDTDIRFLELFETVASLLAPTQQHQQTLAQGADKYDFVHANGTRVKANGYRSLLFLLRCCLLQLHGALQKCAKERGSIFYLPVDHLSNITAYTRALQGLDMLLQHAAILMRGSPNDLFHDGELSHPLKTITSTEYINRDVFYGRCLGFQYPSSLKPVLKMVAIGMASYERWYRANKDDPIRQLLQSLWKGSKYLQSPSQMGMKLDALTQDCSIYFTKAFWSIVEQDAVKAAMALISQSVEISQPLEVPAKHIKIQGSHGEVTLSPPFSDLGYRPIPLLLISYKWRTGQRYMYQSSKKQAAPLSSGLLVHMHGGGYVAQSPKSHEMYLRWWSKELDVPVVSIDYTLAPEAPFPRALDECVFAYVWMLQNLEQIGTTGEHIVFVGDSAGGNFVITASMKLKELGLRLPDRIVSIYPSTDTTSSISPSRFMGLVDLILPLGVLLTIQSAICGCVPSDDVMQERRDARKKILRAKGIYLVDVDKPANSSPALIRKLEQKTIDDEKKVPPPRPPPPISRLSFTARHTDVVASVTTKPTSDSPAIVASATSHTAISDRTTVIDSAGKPTAMSATVVASEMTVTYTAGNKEGVVSVLAGTDQEPEAVTTQGNGSQSSSSNSETSLHNVDLDETDGEKKGAAVSKPKPKVHKPLSHQGSFIVRQEPQEEDKLSPAEIQDLISKVIETYMCPDIAKDPLLSPALAPDDMLLGLPPVHIIGTALDPLLDDSIAMAKRLRDVGQPVTLNVMDNLPHGFLCIFSAGNDPDLQAAHKLCLSYLQQGISGSKK